MDGNNLQIWSMAGYVNQNWRSVILSSTVNYSLGQRTDQAADMRGLGPYGYRLMSLGHREPGRVKTLQTM